MRLRTSDGACVAELRALGRASRSTIVGHDLSFAVQEAAAGATYTDRGRAALPEQILAAHGANWVRLRLWVDPPAGYSDLPSVLAMARRAKAAGMRILLDPHYSDFWADPQKQPIPASWPQDLPSLAAKVHDYTRDALDALSAQGTPAQMLQLGNEIRNGILWPTGQLDGSADQWDRLGTLLRAAAAGARDAKGPTPRLVVHYDQGGDNAGSRWFYDNVVAQHVPFDVIGLSYYPFWHGTLSQLRTNVDDLAQRYHRDVSVVETQYGWTLDNGDQENNFLWTPDLLVPGYPATPGGQLGFASDLDVDPRRGPRRPRARRLLLAAGVDPGHRLAAGRRHAERQPDAVRLQRARPAGRELRRPAARVRALRAGAGRRLRGLGGGAARQDAAHGRALDEDQRPRAGIAVDAVQQVGGQRRVRRRAHDEHRVVGALQQDGAILAEARSHARAGAGRRARRAAPTRAPRSS